MGLDEDGRLSRAQRLHLSGEAEAAERAYRCLLDDSELGASARHWLGFLLSQQDRLDEALPLLEQAVAADGSHAEWHFNLGLARARRGMDEPAAAALRRAAELDPTRYFYWTNLGAQLLRMGRGIDAEQALLQAERLDPQCPDAFYLLTQALLLQERHDEARRCNARGVLAEPPGKMPPLAQAQALCQLGRMDEAREMAEGWLRMRPDHPVARHLLAAFGGADAPAACAEAYVGSAFDAAAPSFEQDLARLRYRGPQWLTECLARHAPGGRALSALDLGCGTGLAGERLQPYVGRLDGVDLSGGMLAQAQAKGIYASLAQAELRAFLRSAGRRWQLIACMDTLTYLGDLDEVFACLARQTEAGGLLLFCVERLGDAAGDYQLHHSGRYRHASPYLDRLLGDKWSVLERAVMPMRDEAGCPVEGEFICAQRLA
ncbi:methyltransferase domain-containing protein [Chromobacterium sp. IIBBL 290-4]|uniref:methyltransferase domain-containing protein n=1 Tax=Chromobacterium sp. IIBBL 290-4 TaxID=2953890 RepID=UPI0020B7F012|nr:tetratricopeptide repeat protein [Chromobacterium sp. IIBBL 290-4]UTH74720.1 tetratricopeptide repeat protein [Chromobacterium sp. IIBBL 290-4]